MWVPDRGCPHQHGMLVPRARRVSSHALLPLRPCYYPFPEGDMQVRRRGGGEMGGLLVGCSFSRFLSGVSEEPFPSASPSPALSWLWVNPAPSGAAVWLPPMVPVPQSARAAPAALSPPWQASSPQLIASICQDNHFSSLQNPGWGSLGFP